MGKPQRREQEPGRFQSTWPVLEFTQLICKSNANLSSFHHHPSPKSQQIRPRWKQSLPDQLRVPRPLAGLPLQSPHVCYRKAVSNSYQYLGFMWDLPAKDFPLLDEKAQSTDGEKEALRDSGTFPGSNKTPGGWQGSWNLLTTTLGYQHASWGRRKYRTRSPKICSLVSALPLTCWLISTLSLL